MNAGPDRARSAMTDGRRRGRRRCAGRRPARGTSPAVPRNARSDSKPRETRDVSEHPDRMIAGPNHVPSAMIDDRRRGRRRLAGRRPARVNSPVVPGNARSDSRLRGIRGVSVHPDPMIAGPNPAPSAMIDDRRRDRHRFAGCRPRRANSPAAPRSGGKDSRPRGIRGAPEHPDPMIVGPNHAPSAMTDDRRRDRRRLAGRRPVQVNSPAVPRSGGKDSRPRGIRGVPEHLDPMIAGPNPAPSAMIDDRRRDRRSRAGRRPARANSPVVRTSGAIGPRPSNRRAPAPDRSARARSHPRPG